MTDVSTTEQTPHIPRITLSFENGPTPEVTERVVEFTTETPDDCTPIRAGVPTSSFGLLRAGQVVE